MDIILFGIQGSGKGTLAKAIAANFDMNYFETGGELRKLAAEESDLGKKIKSIIEAGHLVSNDVVMEIVENFMNKQSDGKNIVIDGIPRNIEQSKMLEELLNKHNRNYLGILVDIPEEEALRRLTTRRICKNCKEVYPADYKNDKCEKCGGELETRADDNPDSIKTRIEAYKKETVPVINHFKEEDKLIVMDGTPPILEARANMFKIIEDKVIKNS